jgi:hypothetical protein
MVMFQESEFAGGDLIGPELLELASSTPRSSVLVDRYKALRIRVEVQEEGRVDEP